MRTFGQLANACILILSVSCMVKLAALWWLRSFAQSGNSSYSYLGTDYPEQWPIDRKPVLLQFDNPKHFRLDQSDGIAEWEAIVPDNGIVYLGPYKQPFGIAMFHQLRCLNILRAEMVRPRNSSTTPATALVRHCLNYVRQIVLCHGILNLESFQFASHINPINWRGVYECSDWEAVYTATRENQKEYKDWLTQIPL